MHFFCRSLFSMASSDYTIQTHSLLVIEHYTVIFTIFQVHLSIFMAKLDKYFFHNLTMPLFRFSYLHCNVMERLYSSFLKP